LFTLGEPSLLEGVFREAGFVEIVIHAVSLQRRFASTTEAIQAMKNPVLQQLIAKLSDAEREQAWEEISRKWHRFEGPNGFEVPGEVLIAVGTK
jgi:hypothetical protein